jgi:uncharacterized protein YkwD
MSELFSRRQFLMSASAGASWAISSRTIQLDPKQTDLKLDLDRLRTNLLNLINEERKVEKVPRVELDDLATTVATRHAEVMAENQFASHWGLDGLKPYQRYSFAGGYHASQENVSAADNTWSMKFEDLKQDTSYLHVRLYQEKPPHDGHRRAILAPQHTHVGIGLAVQKLRLRLVELFVAKHVELSPISRIAKPQATVILSGQLLKSSNLLNVIEVFYEPLPTPPELGWLRELRSYSLPDESRVLRPVLPNPYTYADRRPGVIEVKPPGKFRVPINLWKETAGIYTVVCWVKRSRGSSAFPATELCIRAE